MAKRTDPASLPDAIKHFDSSPDGALTSLSTAGIVLDRSRASLYRDIKAGRLTLIKIGNSSRIRVGELRKLMGGAA